jgi:hypothetical protein
MQKTMTNVQQQDARLIAMDAAIAVAIRLSAPEFEAAYLADGLPRWFQRHLDRCTATFKRARSPAYGPMSQCRTRKFKTVCALASPLEASSPRLQRLPLWQHAASDRLTALTTKRIESSRRATGEFPTRPRGLPLGGFTDFSLLLALPEAHLLFPDFGHIKSRPN